MFAVVVFFQVKAQFASEFNTLVLKNAKTSLEQESGCHQFDVCFDDAKPGEVFLYELYDDKAAFDVHLASEHFLAFAEASAQMVVDKTLHLYPRVVQK
ncbi:putative quinol monooxygenase [Gammaproteobacteria bacterium AS21]|jgi:quinol monooxygenase YgiN